MGKIITSISVIGGLTLLFWLAGFDVGGGTDFILTAILNPMGITNLSWFNSMTGIVVGVLAVVSSLLLRQNNSDLAVMIPAFTVLLNFLWDFLVVYNQLTSMGSVMHLFALLIFGPFFLLYFIGLVEWWRGVST